jgi:two-component system NtrC family response regulator
VGGTEDLTLDVTLIAASSHDLEICVAEGRFCEDLHQRLNIVTLDLPPLRERLEDVPLLIKRVVDDFGRRFQRSGQRFSPEASVMLEKYTWPGNISELREVAQACVVGCSSDEISVMDLPANIRQDFFASEGPASCPFTLPADGIELEGFERGLLIQALERTGENQSAAARLLGISRYALRYRMDKFGLMPSKS